MHAGTTFKYIRASLLQVQDQTTTQQPPFQFDTTLEMPGFINPSGGPVTVTLTTKVPSNPLLTMCAPLAPSDSCMRVLHSRFSSIPQMCAA